MNASKSSPRGEPSLRAPAPRRVRRRLVVCTAAGVLLAATVAYFWPPQRPPAPDHAAPHVSALGEVHARGRAHPAAASAPTPPTSAERDAALAARWQQWLAKSPIPELVIANMAPWLQGASEDELVQALQALQPIRGVSLEMNRALCRVLLCQLASRDGELAIEVTQGLGFQGERGTKLEEAVYEVWAATNADAALAHVLPRLNGDPEDAPDMLSIILRQMARSDPARVDALAKGYARAESTNLRGVGLRYRQAQFEARFIDLADVDGAFRAAAEEAVSPEEAEAWHGEILEWARTAKDIELAARALSKVTRITNVWAMRDAVAGLANSHPQVVRAFLERLEADPNQGAGDAIRYAVSHASPPQQAATLDWLLNRPPTQRRDDLLEWAAVMLAPKDIPQALRAVSGLSAGVKKTELQHAYGFRWLAAEPERARAQLPAEVVANYNKFVAATAGGALDVIPGAKAGVTFQYSEARPDLRRW